MTRRNDIVRLRHMLDHAAKASRIAESCSLGELMKDEIKCWALVRLLEIIGEAAARVSDEVRTEYPGIPWVQIIALRNRLIHGYDAVDMNILWKVATEDVPRLIEALEAIPDLNQQ